MSPKPRVLHLAYEDHAAPHSGGGSVRTREINQRLRHRFDIDQIFAPYPGAKARVEDGLGYEHVGLRRGGRFASQLGYFAVLPGLVRRRAARYDLVVEDFGAPFGSVGVPRFSRTPTIGVVQWLFAEEKSQQYHLPFTSVETFGVRSHERLIAVSQGIAEQLRDRNAGARIDVVANGLPDSALDTVVAPESERADIVFLGRLDIAHKGLDLLLDAFGSIAQRVSQDLVIVGSGDGADWLTDEIGRRGLGSRVRLAGPVTPADRFDLLAGADAVAMPSRYESFGMVAAEAAAMGTPVAAFDIACLRDLVPPPLRVPAFDVAGYARLLERLCTEATWRRSVGQALPATVSHLSWDQLADTQARLYLEAIAS